MDIIAIIERARNYKKKAARRPARNKPLKEYSGKTPAQLANMMRSMLTARRIEMEEKLLLRKGYNRFFIGCGGKELADVAFADNLKLTDPQVGYYRNKAFDMHRGVSIRQKMLEAIGDPRAESTGGMMIPAHSAYPELSILPQASPTGSHAMEAAHLAGAMIHPSKVSRQSIYPGGAYPKDGVTWCGIGEGSTSSPEFARAVFYAVFDKAPIVFAIYNCGWAISVSVEEQFPEGDPTTPFEGFQRFGLKIFQMDGTDVKNSLSIAEEAIEYARSGKGPVLMNVRVTREGSHSGSDDQSFYMDPLEVEWHTKNDCILKTVDDFLAEGIMTGREIVDMWEGIDKETTEMSAKAVAEFQPKTIEQVKAAVNSYSFEEAKQTWEKYRKASKVNREARFKQFAEKGYYPIPDLPEKAGPMTMRFAINRTLFDLFMLTDDVIMFGEDVADFSGAMAHDLAKQKGMKGKGGVFLVSKNLQREFGNDRCFNTPLDEAGILGRAVGHAYQGRRPIPEIQFLDYMSPGYQILKDRIATAYQRSNRQWRMPMVIRTTYGGYKQGAGSFWHSEGNLGTWMNIPGLLIAVPSNSYDAAGLLKTAWATDDPVLFCESVALYNRRDWEGVPLETPVPDIDELIPFGVARTYNEEASDIGVITFGATVPMCRKAAEIMADKGVNVRIVDLRTVRPMDEEAVLKTARDCGKVLVVTEDRFWGGVGPTIASLITRGEGIFTLEAPVKLVTALDSRVAYGLDGDAICLPSVDKITEALEELHSKY
ncbi:MAG TPA: thiamine pyrophosphate-dependent enzyme [candidate division Zixibacteria bacterium]|nr:thiamine pyrophosphate-dependent enzyme [candidate division Zixibacteria bacterium]